MKWEVAKKANLGIDAKFFHDKLSLTVDIFRDTRDHIFQDRVTLPSYVGMVTYPKSNVGRMHSVGSVSYTHLYRRRVWEDRIVTGGECYYAPNRLIGWWCELYRSEMGNESG